MPKRIRERSMLGLQIKYRNSGHISREVIEKVEICSKYECCDNNIPNIPEVEIKNIHDNFIDPYINIGPYKLPKFSEFQRLMEIINDQLANLGNNPDYKLKLFKGILDALIRGRSMYFYDLQLENEICNLRKKLCEAEELVQKYSSELAFCQGNENGFAIAGNVGIRIKKPKNLIYAQALLNINMAWYIYLYNTKKIEFDKYQGVIQYVKEKGNKCAYDELITILDEKYKDIEDDLLDNNCNSSSNDQSSNSSDCNDSSSGCISRTDSFSSDKDGLTYCNHKNNGPALVLHGSLTIVQTERFGKISHNGEDQLIKKKNKTNKDNKKHNKHKHKKTSKSNKVEDDDLHFNCNLSNPRAFVVPGILSIELKDTNKIIKCKSTYKNKTYKISDGGIKFNY